MKFSDSTITALKNFASINPSILFNVGSKLETMSPAKSIIAKIDVVEEFDTKFAIYELGQFLGVLSLFKDPEIEFFDSYLTVSSGEEKVNYRYADEKMIVTPPSKPITLPSKDVEFTLTEEALGKLQRAGSVLGVPEIAVVGEDGKITVRALDTKNEGSNYQFTVGETDLNFRAVFKTENIKLLPDEYTVAISKQGISEFTSKKASYLIAIEKNSSKF